MNLMNKIKGKTAQILARFFEIVFDVLLFISQMVIGMARGFFGLAGLIVLLGPFAILLIFNPAFLGIVILFALIVYLGNKLIIQLKYLKYMFTEYFYDRADFYLKNKKARYEKFSDYGNKYWQMEAERKRKEQRQKEEEAERIFKESFFGQWENYNSGGYSNYNQYGSDTFNSYSGGFKTQYEDSCNLLGVAYTASKDQIRSAYRQKAKQYHPDINKDEGATEMFQKVNDANTFLTDENIERYRNLN